MERRGFVFLVIVLLIFIVLGSVGFTGLNVLHVIGNTGGKVDYKFDNVKNFVQCFDSDPDNKLDERGICNAQYYLQDKEKLRGVTTLDTCQSNTDVVEYSCGKNFYCQEKVVNCGEGFICDEGRCVEKESYLKLPGFLKA